MAIWIDQQYLIDNSVIDSNAEFSKILPIIKLVQKRHILPILGTNLYNAIDSHITAFIDSATSIPTDYKYLVDEYLRDMIVWFTMCESTPVFKFRYANKGVMVKSSENAQPADDKSLEFVMNNWKSNAEMYGDLLIKYVMADQSKYPEYYNNQSGNVFPRYSSYDVDIYLGTNVEGKK